MRDRPPLRLLLDLDPQQPGEDEVAAAHRLLEPVIATYPRAFHLALADALYGKASFFRWRTLSSSDSGRGPS